MPPLRPIQGTPEPAASRDARFDPARRGALRALGVAAGGLVLLGAGRARAAGAAPSAGAAPRELVLHHTHTGETLRVAYHRAGDYCADGLARVARVLRDHRTGEVHPIDRGLLDALHELAVRLDRDAEYEVISGYRSPKTNAALSAASGGVATRSLHLQGRAIDVRLVGGDLARLRDAALALACGGVGYYPGSRFVHLDTGRVRAWSG